jgi:hypothetical protein
MALGEQSLGLCSTCNSGSLCTRRKGIRLPVLLCEEFDDHTPCEAQRPQAPVKANEDPALDTAMGLCCNCGNRGDCMLQHSPGGIWHCEEYC